MNFFAEVLVSEVLGSFIAAILVLIVGFVSLKAYKEKKFGGWVVRVIAPNGQVVATRPVGLKKAEEILDDISTLSVFLKGIVSPFAWLTIDLVVEGIELGVLSTNHRQKVFQIDLTVEGSCDPKRTPAKYLP